MLKNAHAVAAANASILRAFTTATKASENNIVNATIAPNFAFGSYKKYSTNMVEVGNNEETTALIALATLAVLIVDSSCLQILFSSSSAFGLALSSTKCLEAHDRRVICETEETIPSYGGQNGRGTKGQIYGGSTR